MILDPYRFAPAGGTDPYFANVSLLLNPASPNNSTTFYDLSSNAHTLTRVGSPVHKTDITQFTSSSIGTDNSSMSVNAPDNSVFDFGAGHYTIEAWIRHISNYTNGGIFAKRANTAVYGPFCLYVFSGLRLGFLSSANGSNWGVNLTSSTNMGTTTWRHVAVDYDGTTVRLYLDGVVEASATVSQTVMTNTDAVALCGQSADGANSPEGRIGPARITKGVARYAGAFTPPTAAFPTS
jgi:hypothetical protein